MTRLSTFKGQGRATVVFYVFGLLLLMLLSACGDGSDNNDIRLDNSSSESAETGSAIFTIQWDDTPTIKGLAKALAEEMQSCENVETITCKVYDESNDHLITGDTWPCSAHTGRIDGIPVGQNRKFVILGKDVNGKTVYQGQKTHNIEAGPDNDVGTIEAHPFVPVELTATTISASQINLTWKAPNTNVSFAGYRIYRDEMEIRTSTSLSYNDTGLTQNTEYCYTVSAYDTFGNESGPSNRDCATTLESFDWYRDKDKDKYGDPNDSIKSETQPEGYVSDNTDCNDDDASIKPGAIEACNGIDDDCDGDMDEGLTLDIDNDGYTSIGSCQGSADDCNDGNESIHPGVTEICNDDVDQDCDDAIDCADSECSDDPECQICSDTDSDTYFAESRCGTAVDCNDSDDSIYPGAPELCDSKDNQCPGDSGYGDTDENCDFSIWIGDNDGYGYDVPDNSDLPQADAEDQFCSRKDSDSTYDCSQYDDAYSCESSGECRWVDWVFNNQESSEMTATDGSQYTDAEKYILGWPNANFTITFGPVETGHFYAAKFVLDVSGIQTSRFGASSLYLDDVNYSEFLPDEQEIFGSDVITIPITDPSLFTDGSLTVYFQADSPDTTAIDYFYFQLSTQ